jgi:predicted transcriptional regulator
MEKTKEEIEKLERAFFNTSMRFVDFIEIIEEKIGKEQTELAFESVMSKDYTNLWNKCLC